MKPSFWFLLQEKEQIFIFSFRKNKTVKIVSYILGNKNDMLLCSS